MLKYLENSKILVIVAHPDDEILGVGGTVNRLKNTYKTDVRCLILGEGLTSRSKKRNLKKWKNDFKIHKKNILMATNIIGYNSFKSYDFPDNRFDSVPILDIIKVIEEEKSKFKPEIIFTHHSDDLNIDHQVTFNAVLTAFRPLKSEIAKAILSFETYSSTEWQEYSAQKVFCPNFFVEINNENLVAKIKAMESYIYEKREYPHPRSAESLKINAKRWGVVIGRKYAEAFRLIRGIL